MNRIIDNPNLILLNIGYSELNANWNWENIYSPFARIYYVADGTAITRIENQTYTLKPGHLYLTPPFSLHHDECDSRFSLYYIHFYEKTNNKESVFDTFEFPVEIDTCELGFLLIKRLLNINPERHLRHLDPRMYDNFPTFSEYVAYNNKMPAHSVLETQGILNQLMSRFLENARIKSEKKDARITSGLKFIHENLDKNIRIADLADIGCLSEDHFIRIFKQETGYTPLKYINMKKIEKAQLLLLTSDMPVRNIAFELFIDNISYFNKLFKQHTGKTPGQYRDEYNR